ncbi:hypothetical protein SASPL_144738 [Salvia splendens]|uniref:Uncharacterized protein n=1 Tax=Salvia splendens TaxID=180675 RepID=A0A8X8WH37_SALSN|nr:hypothetical protein SASPL_144738 [Salvia splendens]
MGEKVYKEKENKVVITVVCCNPEKFRDKLCCKGAKVIKSIEIVDPPKPKPVEPEKPKPIPEKPKPVDPEKPKPVEPEKTKPIEPEKPKPPPRKPEQPKPPTPGPGPIPALGPCGCQPPPPILGPGPCGCPPVSPVRTCCGPCSQGYGGGPCYFGHGQPPPPMPQPCFDGCYVYGWHDRPCHVTRCDYYFSEENPQACSIIEIRDQVYKEKENKVVITVVCCNPEKIRDKLCYKGAKVIISIEIVDPLKPDKPEDAPPLEQPTPPASPVKNCCGPCSQGYGGGPCYFGYGSQPMPQPCFDGYYVYGCHDRPCLVTRCDYYFIEENPQACSIM